MVLLAKLIAIALIMMGCAVVLKRKLLEKAADYVKADSRVYIIAVLRIVIGVIFIIAAMMKSANWIVPVLGWLIIMSGAFVFAIDKKKTIAFVDKIFAHPSPMIQRLIGTIPILIGVLVISAL